MDQFATRKIISAIVLLITGLVIVFIKGDIPTNLLGLMQTLYGAFVLGNAFEHYTNSKVAAAADKDSNA